jgi:hypothetical protein
VLVGVKLRFQVLNLKADLFKYFYHFSFNVLNVSFIFFLPKIVGCFK